MYTTIQESLEKFEKEIKEYLEFTTSLGYFHRQRFLNPTGDDLKMERWHSKLQGMAIVLGLTKKEIQEFDIKFSFQLFCSFD